MYEILVTYQMQTGQSTQTGRLVLHIQTKLCSVIPFLIIIKLMAKLLLIAFSIWFAHASEFVPL
jgi:hypothetical protein